MRSKRDFSGEKHGNLTVLSKLELEGEKRNAQSRYWCKCDCGNEMIKLHRQIALVIRPTCQACKYHKASFKKGIRFGRNENGFIDKNIIEKLPTGDEA